MFVQVIQGQVADREGLRRLGERWVEELRPGAAGFLGGTMGITDEGWLVNVARFESEEAARANSERPEQGAWWAEASKCFGDDPTFIDSSDVELILGGGSDAAGFVQAMVGHARDRAAYQAADRQLVERLAEARPDVLGGIRIWHDDDKYVEVIYFTSEEDARAGESKGLPDDVRSAFEAMQAAAGPVGYHDLRNPIFL